MVQLNPVPVFGAKKNTSTIWRKFFTEISVQMISAPCNIPVTQRFSLPNLRYLWHNLVMRDDFGARVTEKL